LLPKQNGEFMRTYFFEATNGFNWGKFAVGIFDDEEWARISNVNTGSRLLPRLGWAQDNLFVWVMDLQTGEGIYVRPGGQASYDLNSKHQVWVCPLYEPFLNWLYRQDTDLLEELSGQVVQLTEEEAPSSLRGYRRARGR